MSTAILPQPNLARQTRIGFAQAASILLVPSDHPENLMDEPRLNERDAKALLTTRQRGETLTADGYTFTPDENAPGIYDVQSEERTRRDKSTYRTQYRVDVRAGTCTCFAFARLGECKHLLGLLIVLRDALRLVGPLVNPPVISTSTTTVAKGRTQ